MIVRVAVWQEGARGGFTSGTADMPGLERVRRLMAPDASQPPLFRLTGIRVVQAGPGSATCSMPASTLLLDPLQWVDLFMLTESAATMAGTAGAAPGRDVRCAAISFHHQRVAELASERLIARASTTHTGRRYSLVDVAVEDAIGRPLTRAIASLVAIPACDGNQRDPVEPTWPTPDPWKREYPPPPIDEVTEVMQLRRAWDESSLAPLHAQLGVQVVEAAQGRHATTLPTHGWLLDRPDRIAGGVIVGLTAWTMGGATATLIPAHHQITVIAQHTQLLRPIARSDGPVLCQARVTHQADEFHVTAAEVTDTNGQVVATAGFTAIATPMRDGAPPPAERLLATIMFSDIVESTTQLAELGDERWRSRLALHHAMVRRQLDAFRGREISTSGDSFLALFDKPARAVQCAKAIRGGLRAEGIEVRIGLHTGECELAEGDISGIAVHATARIQSDAAPGEILVSQTLRDVTAGSGVVYEEAGERALKGFEERWRLFSVPG